MYHKVQQRDRNALNQPLHPGIHQTDAGVDFCSAQTAKNLESRQKMKSNRSWVMVAVTAASVLVVVVWRLGGLAGNSPTTGPAAPNAERNSGVRHTRLETANRLRAHSGLATAVEANVPHQSANAQVIHQFATGLEAIAAESDGSERGNRLAGLIGGLATELPQDESASAIRRRRLQHLEEERLR